MRKREIHSIAHWAMMFLLLMFPLLMVGLSVLDKHEYDAYETKLYEDTTNVPLQDVYFTFSNENSYTSAQRKTLTFTDVEYVSGNLTNNYVNAISSNLQILLWYDVGYSNNYITWDGLGTNLGASTYQFTIKGTLTAVNQYVASDNLSNSLVYRLVPVDDLSYKGDVNKWINGFLNLPVNAWYKSLMNTVGVGFTNSSVMNVIYVMPIYILWVYIFDVIVDCFLVIIKLPHKLLNRLSGGENE